MKVVATFAALSIIVLGAGLGSGQDADECSVLGGVVNGSGGPCQPPKLVRKTLPRYPIDAFEKRIEGTVLVELLIEVDGRVARARILKSIPALDQAAMACVMEWEFTPAVRGGHPVATVARAPVRFRLPDASVKAQDAPNARDIRFVGLVNSPAEEEQRLQTGPPMGPLKILRADGSSRGAMGLPSTARAGTVQRLEAPSFDPQGADFTAWLDRFRTEVYDHWLLPSAYSAWRRPEPFDLGYHGRVDYEFVVERDGSVSHIRVLSSSAAPVLEMAARNALRGGSFLGLPSDYGPPRVMMRVALSYDQKPDDTDPSPTQPRKTPTITLSLTPSPR